MMACHVGCFPHRPFDGFSIPHQDVCSVACLVDGFRIQRESDSRGTRLAVVC
jgi:hypothetical protein